MRKASNKTVKAKPTTALNIPVRSVDDLEIIALGFYTDQVTVEAGGDRRSGVFSGAGLGSPWIRVTWGKRSIAIHATELLAAFVGTFDPETAKSILAANTAEVGVDVDVTQ